MAMMCLGACDGAASEAPIVFAFQKQKRPQDVEAHAKQVGKLLGHALGREVQTQVPLSYAMTVQALVSGKVKNLLGQDYPLQFKQLKEGDAAIYYLAQFPFDSQETLRFSLSVQPMGGEPVKAMLLK